MKYSVKIKLLIGTILQSFLLSVVLGIISYKVLGDYFLNTYINEKKNLVNTLISLLQNDNYKKITKESFQDNLHYNLFQKVLKDTLENDPKIKYLYTIRYNSLEDQYQYILDASYSKTDILWFETKGLEFEFFIQDEKKIFRRNNQDFENEFEFKDEYGIHNIDFKDNRIYFDDKILAEVKNLNPLLVSIDNVLLNETIRIKSKNIELPKSQFLFNITFTKLGLPLSNPGDKYFIADHERNLFESLKLNKSDLINPFLFFDKSSLGNYLSIYQEINLNNNILKDYIVLDIHMDQIHEFDQKIISITFAIFAFGFIFSFLLSIYISNQISSPLSIIQMGVLELDRGNYTQKIQVKSSDEFSILANSFNQMVENLNHTIKALEVTTEEKNMIHESKIKLEEALKELKESQEKLIRSEKLAALGQLVDGVAHELNTPLGAIKASAENILTSLIYPMENLGNLFENFSPEEFSLIESILKSEEVGELSLKELREIKKKEKKLLNERNIIDSEDIVETLIPLGITEIPETYDVLWKRDSTKNLLRFIDKERGIMKKSKIITISVSKTSKIVSALKSLSEDSTFRTLKKANIIEGIESALTVYSNYIRKGIQLEKVFEVLPEIECYRERLILLWTHLLSNSIWAVKGEGQIKILARVIENNIKVSIEDNGVGISSDIQDKVFEPFYTTKKAGEGTGLGLYISKQVVLEHKGEVSFQSSNGRTIFEVVLPISN